MAVSLPYLASNKNIDSLFATIQTAKVPDRFTQDFLATTIGLKGTNDRSMIPFLRALGFIDQSGSPTATYRQLKNKDTAKAAIAAGIAIAYKPLFEANEAAHSLSNERLKGLIAQVAGTDSDMTARIASTFNAIAKQADFSGIRANSEPVGDVLEDVSGESDIDRDVQPRIKGSAASKGLNTQFHYNIQIHLPSNATEEVYLNIFNAIRKTFQ